MAMFWRFSTTPIVARPWHRFLFFLDNSITPLSPDVASVNSTTALVAVCASTRSSSADYTLYDDDGVNSYRKNESASTKVHAISSHGMLSINHRRRRRHLLPGQPAHRTWSVELFCTNPVTSVTADGTTLTNLTNDTALLGPFGYVLDAPEKLLRLKLLPATITKSHELLFT